MVAVLLVVAVALGGCSVTVASLRWLDPSTSAFMLRSQWQKDGAVDQRWVPLAAIAPCLPLAAVAAEDQRFPEHWGFDFRAIREAVRAHAEGADLRGASTISQQTAKNLFLWPEATFLRKGIEAVITLLIEAFWPKARILEIYLNIAQFGPRVFGAEAAAQHYFDRPAAQLTPQQCARLAAVLPAPNARSVRDPSSDIRRYGDWIRRQMRQLGGPGYLGDILPPATAE